MSFFEGWKAFMEASDKHVRVLDHYDFKQSGALECWEFKNVEPWKAQKQFCQECKKLYSSNPSRILVGTYSHEKRHLYVKDASLLSPEYNNKVTSMFFIKEKLK